MKEKQKERIYFENRKAYLLRKMILESTFKINGSQKYDSTTEDTRAASQQILTTRNHFVHDNYMENMEEESENTFNPRLNRPHEPLMRSVSEFGFRPRHTRVRLPSGSNYPLSDRQRTISLNLNCNNTEREPILLDEKSNKTIFVQGR